MSNFLATAHVYDSCPLPLESRCIRILEVHPSDSDTYQAAIRGHLNIVNLDDQSVGPKFTALSYVWGTPGGSNTSCGDAQLEVTASCHSALWHL